MSTIRVDHNAMQGAVGDLSGDANGIQSILDQYDQSIQQQVYPHWEGNTKEAYNQAKAQWNQQMQNMRVTLQNISKQLDSANDDFQSIDNQGANLFG